MKRSCLFLFFFSFLACINLAHSVGKEKPEQPKPAEQPPAPPLPETAPWLTGPLLTPAGQVVPVGFYDIEIYVFGTKTFAQYSRKWNSHDVPFSWSVNPQLLLQFGIGERWDFIAVPQMLYNYNHGPHANRFGDFQTGLDYQPYKHKAVGGSWYPNVKLSLYETFPTGKYKNLSADKNGTDASGAGAYTTTFAVTFSRLFQYTGEHFLDARLYFGYTIQPLIHVHGINVYGGDETTRGRVHLGNTFSTLLGLQYTLTRNWALALDIKNAYQNKTHFSGKTITPVGNGSSDQISLAPAIEYNFSENAGLIGGVWFTVAGRNTSDFYSYVIAFNWYAPIPKSRQHHEYHQHGAGSGKHGGKFM
jgi:hypothetical protein